MSQPNDRQAKVSKPGKLDKKLGEFWVGDPWSLFRKENLSAFEPNRTFLNVRGKTFLDISHLTTADSEGDGRSVVPMDFTHDGRMDLVVRQATKGPLLLYENRLPARHSLTVSLRGRESNRLGIGARVVARLENRKVVRELYPQNGFRSQEPANIHLGLGEAQHVDTLVVHWPSGKTQRFDKIAADQHVVLTEGSHAVETVEAGETIAP